MKRVAALLALGVVVQGGEFSWHLRRQTFHFICVSGVPSFKEMNFFAVDTCMNATMENARDDLLKSMYVFWVPNNGEERTKH